MALIRRPVHADGVGTVAVGGDVQAPITTNVYADAPAFTVEMPPAELPHEPADLAPLIDQPSKLLNARRRVIPFTGRRSELDELTAWRQAGPRRAARLLYAAGGHGKTRLAARAATMAAEAGWAVGWARHRTDTPIGGTPLACADDAALLVVVDYAERWPLSDLRALLSSQARHGGRLRILLLARSLSWWPTADAICDDLGIVTGAPRALAPLAASAADRAELFDAACRRFRELYRSSPAVFTVPGGTADRAYGSVLTVHMAALAAVDAHARGQQPPRCPGDLSRYLLHREHLYRTALHGTAPGAGRTAFLACLTGAMRYRDAAGLLVRTGLAETAGGARDLLDAHARGYPPTTPGTALEPLYPDRLAEDFIALSVPTDRSGGLADPWCADVLTGALFARTGGRVLAHAGRGLMVLAAAAANWPHLAGVLRGLLRADPALAVEAGGAALMAITPHADGAIAAAISRHITERSIDLDPAVAVLSCGILQVSRLLKR